MNDMIDACRIRPHHHDATSTMSPCCAGFRTGQAGTDLHGPPQSRSASTVHAIFQKKILRKSVCVVLNVIENDKNGMFDDQFKLIKMQFRTHRKNTLQYTKPGLTLLV